MRLADLAAEIGITPSEAIVMLFQHDSLGWQIPHDANPFGLKVPPEFVERVREILLGNCANVVKEYIDQKHGHEVPSEHEEDCMSISPDGGPCTCKLSASDLDDLRAINAPDDEEPT
jgi:hypothetical protein